MFLPQTEPEAKGRQSGRNQKTQKDAISEIQTVENCRTNGLASSTYKLQRDRSGAGIYRLKETLNKTTVKQIMRLLGNSGYLMMLRNG